jgi:exosortase K
VLAVVALTIWGMKRHYADARADDLWWILSPTARLVGVMTDTAFTVVPGEGYVSHARLFVIEKSCAGINFMVAAFGMLVFALFHRVGSRVSGGCVLAVSLVASYGAALLVNAARITIAMWLADHPIAMPTFTAADVHRFEGIAVYFAGLMLLHELVRWLECSAALAERKP